MLFFVLCDPDKKMKKSDKIGIPILFYYYLILSYLELVLVSIMIQLSNKLMRAVFAQWTFIYQSIRFIDQYFPCPETISEPVERVHYYLNMIEGFKFPPFNIFRLPELKDFRLIRRTVKPINYFFEDLFDEIVDLGMNENYTVFLNTFGLIKILQVDQFPDYSARLYSLPDVELSEIRDTLSRQFVWTAGKVMSTDPEQVPHMEEFENFFQEMEIYYKRIVVLNSD